MKSADPRLTAVPGRVCTRVLVGSGAWKSEERGSKEVILRRNWNVRDLV